MYFLVSIISFCINLYVLVIILQVAMSWLIALDIVNAGNEAAVRLMTLLQKLTDPIYKPLKKYIPPIGGIDITPLIVIVGLQILGSVISRMLINSYMMPY